MIIGLDHVQLAMPKGSEAQARAFYQDLLCMPEVKKPDKLLAREVVGSYPSMLQFTWVLRVLTLWRRKRRIQHFK